MTDYINKDGQHVYRYAIVDACQSTTGCQVEFEYNTDAAARRKAMQLDKQGWDVYAYKVELNLETDMKTDIGEL
jgi:hypothetical protein